MKITGLSTFKMWAGTRNWLFVKIETDSGIYGWGEGSLEWWEDVVEAAIANLKPLIIGRNPLEVESIVFDLIRRTGWRGGAITGSAISAIDHALWDIAGKAMGAPVYRLLGGAKRTKVRAYASGGYVFTDIERAVSLAKEWTSKGYTALKANPAEGRSGPLDYRAVQETVDVLAAVREAVGDRVDLLLDCHGSPTPPLGILLAEAIYPYHPLFLEEPVQVGDLGAMAEVAAKSRVPIAAGEKLFYIGEFREMCERRAVSILQPDVGHVHGITGAKKIAEMAETYQVLVAPHNSCGPVATAASLHLDAVIPNFLIQEVGCYALPYFEKILKEPLKIDAGYFELPTKPGLGIELDEEAIAENPPRAMPLRDYRHEDGSWSGW